MLLEKEAQLQAPDDQQHWQYEAGLKKYSHP
jgi:hypothetical protein